MGFFTKVYENKKNKQLVLVIKKKQLSNKIKKRIDELKDKKRLGFEFKEKYIKFIKK